MRGMPDDGFYENDEPVSKIRATFEAGAKGETGASIRVSTDAAILHVACKDDLAGP